jgi:hypothetical protein
MLTPTSREEPTEISEMSGADVGCEFRLYFASVSSQPLTVRNKKMSRVFVAAAALFGVPGNGALPEIEYRSLESG